MTHTPVFRLARPMIGFRAGLSLLGFQQGRTKKGQSDCLALPCRIAAQQRSSCSSALLYPLLGIRDFTILFFVKGWTHFHNLDSTVKCNRLIEEYFKRRLEVKAFSRTMIEPVYSNLGFRSCNF